MRHIMTTSEISYIGMIRPLTKHKQTAKEAISDMLKTGYAAASAGLKDAACQFV